ncbi:ABC-type transport auxiliary lipoprotein family protein [Halomonas sp. LR3S48]|uniref:ABC-type transport auxiliary lipoprotein family protein n=1 Tax=Halomonas sp. LR3S48 TaxID=2982694 RepID=UPI0021E47EB2|nr:ABC-type transport auxiliary lipoprotein family protein [Halomonas sp. LR3S48]UYG05829.1 ABC-type transport auxiliary lipoprotein family protein [Halomonas sp. LR3S48]
MTYRSSLPVVMAVVLSLAGCNLVPERTPVTLYELPAHSLDLSRHTEQRIEATLRLATPRASGLLDGSRILVVPLPNQPRAYEGARWADGMPQLIRNRLLDAFQDDGRITRLVHDDSAVSADVELLSDLRTFHSEYIDGLPVATLRLDAKLIDTRSQRLVASQRFVQQQRVESEAIPNVVEAFGMAADRLARELVDWTAAQIDRR